MRIAVIGNGGGGKTTLSRRLAQLYSLPLYHVDSIQFQEGFQRRDLAETSAILLKLAEGESWIIDGFGSREVMLDRFEKADKILFVDFPLWRHYFWCLKRQVQSLWSPRTELPEGCNEATLAHTLKLFQVLWKVHRDYRPWFLDQFLKSELENKVTEVCDLKGWEAFWASGFE